MDDYSISSLVESKNEWCSRLVSILTPALIDGIKSIFNESNKLCIENEEEDKYLMTFQTFLSRIPQWNPNIIDDEKKRIEETSGCEYLDELIACVHIIQLKALTCVRVGQKQKKIDIDIPSVNDFIHNIYKNIARKVYTNIYLFEANIEPLDVQKNNRELEIIVKECIMNTIRENMPIETILKAYVDESYDECIEVQEEIINQQNDVIDLNNDKLPIIKDTAVSKDEIKDDNVEDNVEENNLSDNIVIDTEPIKSDVVDDLQIPNNNISFSDIDNKISTEGLK